jgi:tetratricopeptide (TPR) repeat protein
MRRAASALPALVLALALGCGAGASPPPPPRPAAMGDFDARVRERIDAALARLEEAPRSAGAWAELGMVYAAERLRDLALECFAVAAELEPHQPKWPYRSAVTLGQLGRFDEAARSMERSLALEPGYAPSHARLGEYRLALGDLAAAEAAYRRGTELDSSYPGGWVGLARIALQRDENARALEILERLVADDPEDRTFRQLLAHAQQAAGLATGGEPESFLADEDLPVWNDPWELEALAFRQRPTMIEVSKRIEGGRAAEAIELLLAERAGGADQAETAQLMAQALAMLGRRDEALAELELALRRDPESSSLLLMKVNLLGESGDAKGSLAVLETLTGLHPTFGGAFAAKALRYQALGLHEQALEAFERAEALGIDDYELRFMRGQSLIALTRWKEAEQALSELCAERPGHGDAWLQLGIARLRTSGLEAAEAALAKAEAAGNASPKLLENVRREQAGARTRRERKMSGGAK